MEDDNQIIIPESFLRLYSSPAPRARLLEPVAHVRSRYELCEDMAQMLVEPAREKLHALNLEPEEVLGVMLASLQAMDGVLDQQEPGWVARRLAELLDWDWPGDLP